MPTLASRQQKIQEKRKQTSFRNFVMEMASWVSLNFYKNYGRISRYPMTDRIGALSESEQFYQQANHITGIDSTGNFWKDYQQLFHITTLPLLLGGNTENAQYAENVRFVKNVYLGFSVVLDCENVLYSLHVKEHCRNVFNSIMVWDTCEVVYASRSILHSAFIFYSQYIYNCSNLRYCSNMIGCHECLFCEGLENTSYNIENVQYDKETYFAKKSQILREKGTHTLPNLKGQPLQITSKECINTTFAVNSSHIENGRNVYNVQGGKNLYDVGSSEGNQEVYDSIIAGSPNGNHFYATLYSGP
jgi:hypothetical protein